LLVIDKKVLGRAAAMPSAGSETTPGRDEKWLNAGSFGRSAAKAPQGDGVDGAVKPKGRAKLSSKLRHDEGTRQPSKNMAAASDTRFDHYARGNPSGTPECVDKC